MKARKYLGDILLEQKLITKEQLESTIEEQKQSGDDLATILIRRGQVSRKAIGKILELQAGIPYVNLQESEVDQDALRFLSEEFIRSRGVFPIKKEGDLVYVAMTDPTNLSIVDEIKLITKLQVVPLLTTKAEILEAISKYLVKGRIERAVEELGAEGLRIQEELKEILIPESEKVEAEDAPIVRLVDSILNNAIYARASDIHLEPQESNVRVRYRVDGLLSDVLNFPRAIHRAVVSRIKIISNMNIAESHRPQDGHLAMQVANRYVDVRISTIEGTHGEKVVMRILDKNTALIGLKELGMSPGELTLFEEFLSKPYGIILVTGPTGCGKTTTLYAALSYLNVPTKNIVTIEDPVEYKIADITQIQVNPKAGVTFSTGLRTIVRQDPDIILVGEIRDTETAKIAVEAALTGHLIFSTLHTNDASGAIVRLTEMGIEPFLISSSVIGIIAQRLVRTICPECRETYKPTPEILQKLNLSNSGNDISKISFSRGRGCKSCGNTGYRGRKGIFEAMRVSQKIRRLVLERDSSDIIKQTAISEGMHTMQEDGIKKVLNGTSTPEEVLRVIYTAE